jgi:hypothetical protein
MEDVEREDLPAQVLKVNRLFEEEKNVVRTLHDTPTPEEVEEQARPVLMPPLREDELPIPSDIPLNAQPDEALDDPAITDAMKSSDDYISKAFLKLHKGKLLRPWDDIDLSEND